jgi:hypothetical protein
MPPETPNPNSPKAIPPHRLIWLFGAAVAPVFSIPWIVAELQGRQFSDAVLLIMLAEGVAVTLLLRWLCQLWPDLLTSALRGTQPKSAWKKPAAVGVGIAMACVANSFFSAYGLVGIPVAPSPDRGGLFTLLLLVGMIWLIGAFAFVLAITAAVLKPIASVQEVPSTEIPKGE